MVRNEFPDGDTRIFIVTARNDEGHVPLQPTMSSSGTWPAISATKLIVDKQADPEQLDMKRLALIALGVCLPDTEIRKGSS